jgi:hypothetical protein
MKVHNHIFGRLERNRDFGVEAFKFGMNHVTLALENTCEGHNR